jgi:Uma2 family endonuclease
MLVEVADSSPLRDQRDKTRIYARANIPVYWIINLVDRRVEVYSQPTGPMAVPAYQSFQTYQPGDTVLLILDGTTVGSIPVDDLLP